MTLKPRTWILTRFVLSALLMAGPGLTGTASVSHAAQDVPTSRIIVPEEGDVDLETDPEVEIPTGDLPVPGALTNEEKTPPTTQNELKPRLTGPPPPVMRDISKLPAAVRQTRQNILDAAATGDIDKLRFLIGVGENATDLSIGGIEGDPIAHLKGLSGDPDGQEVLAILTEIFEAGYVHVGAGGEDEMYIWPYFFVWPLEKLTPPMRVELFRILTAGDLEDSAQSGGYIFYRAGIKPDGTWNFFVAGD